MIMVDDLTFCDAQRSFNTMGLGLDGVEVIMKQFDLVPFLTFFEEQNLSTALYHDTYHAHCVVLNCYEGACFENLPFLETRALLLGALFHDFNHSGGVLPDEENIKLALEGLERAQLKHRYYCDVPLSDEELELAEQAIRITKYPYEAEPITLAQQIIRDADLMQPYEEDPSVLREQYLGLKSELELTRGHLEALDFVNGMRSWLDEHVRWHTNWAVEKAKVRGWAEIKQRLVGVLN